MEESKTTAATAPPAAPAAEPRTEPLRHSTQTEGGFLSGLTDRALASTGLNHLADRDR